MNIERQIRDDQSSMKAHRRCCFSPPTFLFRLRRFCILCCSFVIVFIIFSTRSAPGFALPWRSAASSPRLLPPALSRGSAGPALDVLELGAPGPPLPPSTPAEPLTVVLAVHLHGAERAAAAAASWAVERLLQLRSGGAPVGFLRVAPLFFFAAPPAPLAPLSTDMPPYYFAAPEVRDALSAAGRAGLALPAGFSATMRTEHMLRHAAAAHPAALWLFKADDDSFVHVGRLLRSLLARNASAPQLVGAVAPPEFGAYRFVSGGAGYALSAAALAAIAPRLVECNSEASGFRHTTQEDVMVTKCVKDVFGEGAIVDNPGLNWDTPEAMLRVYPLAHALVAPISHHYITPARAAAQLQPRFPRTLTHVVPFSAESPRFVLGKATFSTCADPSYAQLVGDLAVAVAACGRAAQAAGLEYVLVTSVDAGGGCEGTPVAPGPAVHLAAMLRVLFERGGVVAPFVPGAAASCGDAAEVSALLDLAEASGEVAMQQASGLDDPSSWVLGSSRHAAAATLARGSQPPRLWAASQFNHDIFRLLAVLTLGDGARRVHAGSGGLAAALGAAAAAVHARIAPAPLRVATHAMWLGADVVMDELWMLSDVALRAVGRSLVPVDPALPEADALAGADVILIGAYGDRVAASSVARRHGAEAVTIFVASENTDGGPFEDQLVGDVALSFGHRRETPPAPTGGVASAAAIDTAYLRLPWWLPYTVRRESGACALPPSLYAAADPAAWRARPGFTALLSSHYGYPRGLLFNLTSTLGRVEAPGKAFHNAEWPAALPNHHLRGKVEYLGGFRFTICPENSRTRGSGGYNTEKLAQAHLAGAVPIYWGDAIDAEVFNPARVLVFDGTNGEAVLDTMRRLQDDEGFRAAWFAQPVLAPTAGKWLEAWCAEAARLFRAAVEVLEST